MARKKWQIPVLLIGVVLLAYFGFQTIKTFQTAGGAARPAVTAKAPEHVKERAPVSEETEGTPSPTPAPGPAAVSGAPAEELATIDLPAGDVLRPLETELALTGAPTGTREPSAPALLPTEIPPAALVAAPGTAEEGPAAAAAGAASRVRRRGSGYPKMLPERTQKEESYRCVGTITGQRRIAILTDLSAAGGASRLFIAEGERIPGPKRLVVAKVEPGSVVIKTALASTTLKVEPAAGEQSRTSVASPLTGVPRLR